MNTDRAQIAALGAAPAQKPVQPQPRLSGLAGLGRSAGGGAWINAEPACAPVTGSEILNTEIARLAKTDVDV
jgi:hypothetical protein